MSTVDNIHLYVHGGQNLFAIEYGMKLVHMSVWWFGHTDLLPQSFIFWLRMLQNGLDMRYMSAETQSPKKLGLCHLCTVDTIHVYVHCGQNSFAIDNGQKNTNSLRNEFPNLNMEMCGTHVRRGSYTKIQTPIYVHDGQHSFMCPRWIKFICYKQRRARRGCNRNEQWKRRGCWHAGDSSSSSSSATYTTSSTSSDSTVISCRTAATMVLREL